MEVVIIKNKTNFNTKRRKGKSISETMSLRGGIDTYSRNKNNK